MVSLIQISLVLLISKHLCCFSVLLMLQVIALNTWLQRGEMDLKRSYGVPASALERTWSDQTQLLSNTRSRIKCRPSQLASHAVALVGPMIPSLSALHRSSYVRLNARSTIDRIHHCDRTHSLQSSAVL
jgi:hypothetical protein